MDTPGHFTSARRGMTLIEVVVAMFVLTVVFAGVLTAMVRAAAITNDARIVYRETAILNDVVEKMRSLKFADLKTDQSGEIPPSDSDVEGKTLGGAYTYCWKRTFTGTDPLQITIEVYPKQRPGKIMRLVTYVSSSGLVNKN